MGSCLYSYLKGLQQVEDVFNGQACSFNHWLPDHDFGIKGNALKGFTFGIHSTWRIDSPARGVKPPDGLSAAARDRKVARA